jgi:hypothetical protein
MTTAVPAERSAAFINHADNDHRCMTQESKSKLMRQPGAGHRPAPKHCRSRRSIFTPSYASAYGPLRLSRNTGASPNPRNDHDPLTEPPAQKCSPASCSGLPATQTSGRRVPRRIRHAARAPLLGP